MKPGFSFYWRYGWKELMSFYWIMLLFLILIIFFVGVVVSALLLRFISCPIWIHLGIGSLFSIVVFPAIIGYASSQSGTPKF